MPVVEITLPTQAKRVTMGIQIQTMPVSVVQWRPVEMELSDKMSRIQTYRGMRSVIMGMGMITSEIVPKVAYTQSVVMVLFAKAQIQKRVMIIMQRMEMDVALIVP